MFLNVFKAILKHIIVYIKRTRDMKYTENKPSHNKINLIEMPGLYMQNAVQELGVEEGLYMPQILLFLHGQAWASVISELAFTLNHGSAL